MEQIYSLVQENPKFFAWIFGIINVLWGIFLYFNKQSHDKNLAKIKNELSIEAEKKKKLFEMKVQQYEKYFNLIDSFNHKYSVDINDRLFPIISEFLDNYLKANEDRNETGKRNAILELSHETNNIVNEIHREFMTIAQETNSLKLIASNETVKILDEIKEIFNSSVNIGTDTLRKFVELSINNDMERIKEEIGDLSQNAKEFKEKSDKLLNQMRNELAEFEK